MMLRGHDNVQEELSTDCHGGTGEFAVRTLLEEEFGSSLAYVRELVLRADSSIGIHAHQGDEEIYYIVEVGVGTDGCPSPPPQIPASAVNALGSSLGS